MAPAELFSQLIWVVNLCLKSYTFCLFLSYSYMCGSGSGSTTKLLKTDPIRIQYGSGSTILFSSILPEYFFFIYILSPSRTVSIPGKIYNKKMTSQNSENFTQTKQYLEPQLGVFRLEFGEAALKVRVHLQ